jgi:SAM-dependent methyltransferase
MQRIPEPELMDEQEQAIAYAEADFEEPNSRFVETFETLFGAPQGRMLDLGCGPADIPLRFVRRNPSLSVTAVDGSPAMIELAHRALQGYREAGSRLFPVCATLQELTLEQRCFDAVISNSLLHHLHEPQPFWASIGHYARAGAAVLIMDLSRPEGLNQAQTIINTYAADEPEVLRKDFYNSLLAAFTPQEVEAQLAQAGLEELKVEAASDRHWIAYGLIQDA